MTEAGDQSLIPAASSAFSRREDAFLRDLKRGLWQLDDRHVDAMAHALNRTVWWRRAAWYGAVLALGGSAAVLAGSWFGALGGLVGVAATVAGLLAGSVAVPDRALFRRLEKTAREQELVRPARDVLYRLLASCRSVDVATWLSDFARRLGETAAAPTPEAEARLLAGWLDADEQRDREKTVALVPAGVDDRAREAFVEVMGRAEKARARRDGLKRLLQGLLAGGGVTAYTVLFFGLANPEFFPLFFHGLVPLGFAVFVGREVIDKALSPLARLLEQEAAAEEALGVGVDDAQRLLEAVHDEAERRGIALDEAAASVVYDGGDAAGET